MIMSCLWCGTPYDQGEPRQCNCHIEAWQRARAVVPLVRQEEEENDDQM
ncbi:MAG: hypothetical protein ACYSW3_00105 [Planctomycetota bacterium]|jgi:hypothetical protein